MAPAVSTTWRRQVGSWWEAVQRGHRLLLLSGALAHVGDVLSQPGRTRIMHGSVLQLLKDLVQPSAWPLLGEQHRQVQRTLGVWRPSQLPIMLFEPSAQRRIGEMVAQQGNRPAAKRIADRGGQRRKPHPGADRPPRALASALRRGAPIRRHSGQSFAYKAEGLAVGARSGSPERFQSQPTLEATARLIRNSTLSAVSLASVEVDEGGVAAWMLQPPGWPGATEPLRPQQGPSCSRRRIVNRSLARMRYSSRGSHATLIQRTCNRQEQRRRTRNQANAAGYGPGSAAGPTPGPWG